ncbi:MAG: DUF6443 domain-containing protein, partial [Flavobacteriaceae bacterium]|nr:DUF6443 domain-containing protein [Flavobacteriaceae bacterium]
MKNLFLLIIIAIPLFVFGQTPTENYTLTTAYLIETQDGNVLEDEKLENIIYFDGLGRPKQSIAIHGGGNREDIISPVLYDEFGRKQKSYLPYVLSENNGEYFNGDIVANIKTYYKDKFPGDFEQPLGQENPYAETIFDNSPLNRVLQQAAPGSDWSASFGEHTIKYEYNVNEVDDVKQYSVLYIENNLTPELQFDGFYPKEKLFKKIIKDENWNSASGRLNTIETFTDKNGRIILSNNFLKIDGNTEKLSTYFVYDNLGRLIYKLPPQIENFLVDAVAHIISTDIVENNNSLTLQATETITLLDGFHAKLGSDFLAQIIPSQEEALNDFAFQYIYDDYNRLIEQKTPGKGWEYLVYNDLDQPILTQDANLKLQNEWLFTKYDVLGRVVYSGIVTSIKTRPELQIDIDNANTTLFEHRESSPITIAGTSLYYSNNSFPSSIISEIYTIYYYDDYVDHVGVSLPNTVFGKSTQVNTKGLATVSRVRVLDEVGSADWIVSLTGYDDKARLIFVTSKNNYLNTTDILKNKLNFSGSLLESLTTHSKSGNATIITHDYYFYDHEGRLLTHQEQLDNEPQQLIVNNEYDELGQLITKKVGGDLFESGYTDLVNVSITGENVITKNQGADDWDAGIATIGEMNGEGGLSFTIESVEKNLIVGLNDFNNNNSVSDMDYGFYFITDNDNPSYYKIKTPSGFEIEEHAYQQGQNFSLEKIGNSLYYYHNGNEIHSVPISNPNIPLIGDAGFKTMGAAISNLNFYAINVTKHLQEINYKYNIRGRLTDINDVNEMSTSEKPDLFNFKINYNEAIEGTAGASDKAVPLFNGNISQTIWRTNNIDNEKHTYGYKYDALNQITAAYSRKGNSLTQDDNHSIWDVNYSKNGNVLTLHRNGANENNSTSLWDDLTYQYDGNQLISVTDASNSSSNNQGFFVNGSGSSALYTYDVNGNIITDSGKNITAISYNHFDLPVQITIDNNDLGGTITYIYDAAGTKLEKKITPTSGDIQTTQYAGNYIYQKIGTEE